jgi:hypothetical protein
LRRSIPVWLLISLLFIIPDSAHSQTRFFERGDSGFTGTWEIYTFNSGRNSWTSGGFLVAYTHKGLFDVGAGFVKKHDGQKFSEFPKQLFGNFLVLKPRSAAGVGLELRGRYFNQSSDSSYSPIPSFDHFHDRIYQTGLRLFYRLPFTPKSGMIVGLGSFYRFNKNQVRDSSDEVLFGHDYGEVGFALDIQFLVLGFVHFSMGGEYAQDNEYWDKWEYSTTLGLGILIGRSSGQDGVNHD